MYHVLIRRQIIKLSNDITIVKMGKRILLKISREFEKNIFFLLFEMKFSGEVGKAPMEGTVSQISFIGPSFCFWKSRKKGFKNVVKVARFFQIQ